MTRAEELKVLVAAHTRQLHHLESMAATDTGVKTKLEEAEDRASQFVNGGGYQKTTHQAATYLEKLIMLKTLRMDLPHISMQIKELEHLIAVELKKAHT